MNKWRESADTLAKVGAIALGAAYASGFFIVNLRLRIQATRVLGLFAEQYLVAGFWFLLISFLVILAGAVTAISVVNAFVPFRKWRSMLAAVGWAALAIGTAGFLLISPLRYFGVEFSERWFWFTVIGFVGGIVIVSDFSDLVKSPKTGDLSAHKLRYGTQLTIRAYLVLCILVVNFSKDVFPTIPSQLGGGEFPVVYILADSSTRADLASLGVEQVPESRELKSYLMIATENTIVLTLAPDSHPPIIVPRSGITAMMVYSREFQGSERQRDEKVLPSQPPIRRPDPLQVDTQP